MPIKLIWSATEECITILLTATRTMHIWTKCIAHRTASECKKILQTFNVLPFITPKVADVSLQLYPTQWKTISRKEKGQSSLHDLKKNIKKPMRTVQN